MLSGSGWARRLWRLYAALVALCGSLLLAAPSAWAASFDDDEGHHKTIDDQTFGLPGSGCSGDYAANVNLKLPGVSTVKPGDPVSYTLTDGDCTLDTGETSCGLPPGLTLTTDPDPASDLPILTGTLAADLKTASAVSHTLTYTAEDSDGADSLTFEIAIVEERPALRALYTATNGAEWTNAWPATIDDTTCLEDLYGVALTPESGIITEAQKSDWIGRVRELKLSDNNLDGEIPKDVTHLHALSRLNLSHNHLEGEIPEGLEHVERLNFLNLSHNHLTGEIPEDVTHLHFLATAILSHNHLTGEIPLPEEDAHEEYGHAGHNLHLNFSHNHLTGEIPAELLKAMPRLISLDLSHNHLTGEIPPIDKGLINLGALNLSHNHLTGKIPKPGTLQPLALFDLSGNQLEGEIPKDLAHKTKLHTLNLSDNQLSGSIPAALGNLSALRTLNLGGNHLIGTIPAGGDSTNPTGLAKLTTLWELSLNNNQLSGSIPAALGNVGNNRDGSALLTLNLGGNQLRGPIPAGREGFSPTGLARLAALKHLGLHDNDDLTGPVPDPLGDLANPLFGGTLTLLCLPSDLDKPPPLLPITLTAVPRCPTPAIPGPGALYGQGDTIKATLTFDQAVTVDTTSGTPTLTLQIGDAARAATYAGLSRDQKTLTFSYPVQAGDGDADGIAIATDQLRLNGGTLKDSKDNDVFPMHHALPAQPGHLVGTRPPPPTLHPGPHSLTVSWEAWTEEGYQPTLYQFRYCRGACSAQSDPRVWTYIHGSSPPLTAFPLKPGQYTVQARVQMVKAGCTEGCRTISSTWTKATPVTVVAGDGSRTIGAGDGDGGNNQGGNGGNGSNGREGGGGGGRTASRDRHGNTPAQATPVRLRATAPWRSSTPGEINTFRDRDYFRLSVPHAGILVVETSGTTDTVGTVWQAGDELGTATDGGPRRNFRLSVPVAAGPVVIAVTGNRGRTGRYSLRTRLLVGVLENPAPRSFQSGIGVISGWVCAAEAVEIELNGQRQPAAIGTARADTAPTCGHSATGFGLLFNWNLLGDGEHEVVAFVDDIELIRATVTVTTLGAEIVEDAVGQCEVPDFPSAGESVTLQWQASSQNFVITEGAAPTAVTQAGIPGVGFLENPSANAFQSGIGLISGWVCDAERVEIVFNAGPPQAAGYGTARADTVLACGDSDNGFGLLYNWNLLGDGEHTVAAVVDGAELGRAVVRVTTLGEETVEEAEGECVVADFPRAGASVTLAWQPSRQNFVIVAHEAAAGP